MVERNRKSVANHLCKEAAVQDIWHTGLPEDDMDIKQAIGEAIP